ncbi:MAG: hypothetical protein Q4B70_07075, partial [Lachnospiraceae bacterium]|nr:hypothetical protein [Lachnospiraceae bacterium]
MYQNKKKADKQMNKLKSMMTNSFDKTGMFLIVISAVLFGMMPMLAKIAYQYGSNAYSVAFGRFFIGSMILLCIIKI